MGFDKDAIVTVQMNGNYEVFAKEISQYPSVQLVSLHRNPPCAQNHWETIFKCYVNDIEKEVSGSLEICDENYIPVYDLQLIAGRNLLPSTYMKEFVVNETFARQLGFSDPQDAVGCFVWSGIRDDVPESEEIIEGQRLMQIAGVVADFHSTTLHEYIQPIALSASNYRMRTMSIKLATTGKGNTDLRQILSDIEQTWQKVNPGERLEMSFYDEFIASLYEQEQRVAQIVSAAMLMAIFISCLGLYGLVVFTTKRRTKEIGIRKVLGASISNIVMLISGSFLKLVFIAALIAIPVAWFVMHKWLEGFAYRTSLHWWIFVLAYLMVTIITLATISLHTIKVARANPVNSIKNN